MKARVRPLYSIPFLALLCGCHQAPEINVLGSFFPAWVLCCALALPVAWLVRRLLMHADLEDHVGPLVVFYGCVGLAAASLSWLLFFR